MDIKLTDLGDLDLTGAQASLTSGTTATKQRYKQRLSLFFAEWFLDRTRGVPYTEQIFVKNPNPAAIDAIFKNEILSDPATRELQLFELDLDALSRNMTVTFRALTDDGPIDFSEVFS